jgi:hypothetical protein
MAFMQEKKSYMQNFGKREQPYVFNFVQYLTLGHSLFNWVPVFLNFDTLQKDAKEMLWKKFLREKF